MLAKKRWIQIYELSITTLISAGVVVGYLVSSMFGNLKFYTGPYFFIFLGFLAAEKWDMSLFDTLYRESTGKNTASKKLQNYVTWVVIIAIIGFTIVVNIYRQVERTKENYDLANMRLAKSTAELLINQGKLSEGEYWFDAEKINLVTSELGMPLAYGQGTTRNGRTETEYLSEFYGYNVDENGDEQYTGTVRREVIALDYDTAADYTGSVVRVFVSHVPWDHDRKVVSVSWVDRK